jgi:hypothetical protein
MIILTIFEMSEGPKECETGAATYKRQRTFGPAFLRLAFPAAAGVGIRRVITLLLSDHAHRLLKIILTKFAFFIQYQIYTFTTERKQVMLQRCGSKISVNDMTRLFMQFTYPLGKLHGIRNSSG